MRLLINKKRLSDHISEDDFNKLLKIFIKRQIPHDIVTSKEGEIFVLLNIEMPHFNERTVLSQEILEADQSHFSSEAESKVRDDAESKVQNETESKSQLDNPSRSATQILVRYVHQNEHMKIGLVLVDKMSPYFIIKPKNRALKDDNFFMRQVHKFKRSLKEIGYLEYAEHQNQGTKAVQLLPVYVPGDEVDINRKMMSIALLWYGKNILNGTLILPEPMKPNLSNYSEQSLSYVRNHFWINEEALTRNLEAILFSTLESSQVLTEAPIEPDSEENKKNREAQSLEGDTHSQAIEGAEFSSQTSKQNTTALISSNTSDKTPRNTTACAFCNPKVIENQMMIHFGKVILLMCYAPYVGSKVHFLILPARHREDWSDLEQEERYMIAKIVKHLTTSIQANCKISQEEIITYVQNGIHAGQTIPHVHMHLLSTPALLPYLIDVYGQMLRMSNATLTPIQMKTLGDVFKPTFLEGFSSELEKIRSTFAPEFLQNLSSDLPLTSQYLGALTFDYSRKMIERMKGGENPATSTLVTANNPAESLPQDRDTKARAL